MEDLLRDIKELTIKHRDIRFLFGMLAIIAIYVTKRAIPGPQQQPFFYSIGAITILGILMPKPFTPLYRICMIGSMCIGLVVSSILFSIAFFIGFTPISMLMSLTKQKPMNLSWKSSNSSYWEKKKKQISSLEKQY